MVNVGGGDLFGRGVGGQLLVQFVLHVCLFPLFLQVARGRFLLRGQRLEIRCHVETFLEIPQFQLVLLLQVNVQRLQRDKVVRNIRLPQLNHDIHQLRKHQLHFKLTQRQSLTCQICQSLPPLFHHQVNLLIVLVNIVETDEIGQTDKKLLVFYFVDGFLF